VAAAQPRFSRKKDLSVSARSRHSESRGTPTASRCSNAADRDEILRLLRTNGWNYEIGPAHGHRLVANARARPPLRPHRGWGSIGGGPVSAPPSATADALARRFTRSVPTSWSRNGNGSRRLGARALGVATTTVVGLDGTVAVIGAVFFLIVVGYIGVSAVLRRIPADVAPPADRRSRTQGQHREDNVPLARGLSSDEREVCSGWCKVFLTEKHFEACGGPTLTER